MILYFHGFASHGKSWKPELLRKHLAQEKIISPTLPVHPIEVVKYTEKEIIKGKKPVLLVGSSLGGFYAYYLSMIHDIPAIILNPAMRPWAQLTPYIGSNKRSETGEEFLWKEAHIDALKSLNDKIEGTTRNFSNLHFFLSIDDESLDHHWIKEGFPDAGSIRYYNNCKHRFNRFEEIISEIKKILKAIKQNSC